MARRIKAVAGEDDAARRTRASIRILQHRRSSREAGGEGPNRKERRAICQRIEDRPGGRRAVPLTELEAAVEQLDALVGPLDLAPDRGAALIRRMAERGEIELGDPRKRSGERAR